MLRSFGCKGVDALGAGGTYLEGFEVIVIRGVNHEMGAGGFGSLGGSLQNMLLLADDVAGCVTVCEAILNASFAMQFSLHKITAAYHSCGISSEGCCPEVRHVLNLGVEPLTKFQDDVSTLKVPRSINEFTKIVDSLSTLVVL